MNKASAHPRTSPYPRTSLVPKLCLGTRLWTETPFRMEGVSAGAELDVADTHVTYPQTPRPRETEFRPKVRDETEGE